MNNRLDKELVARNLVPSDTNAVIMEDGSLVTATLPFVIATTVPSL